MSSSRSDGVKSGLSILLTKCKAEITFQILLVDVPCRLPPSSDYARGMLSIFSPKSLYLSVWTMEEDREAMKFS